MTPKSFKHRFRGKAYRVISKRPSTAEDGDCHWGLRRIRIAPNLSDAERMDTLLHEGIHADLPDLKEDVVEVVSRDLGRLLRKAGY